MLCIPGSPTHKLLPFPERAVLIPHGNAEPIAKLATSLGLRKFTVPLMRQLQQVLGAELVQRGPNTSQVLLTSIITKQYGEECTPELVASIAELRHATTKMWEFSLESPLLTDDVWSVLDEDLQEDEVADELHEAMVQAAAKQARAEQAARVASNIAGGGSSGAASSGGAPPRREIDWAKGPFAQHQAKAFIPPSASVSKATIGGSRWRGVSPYISKTSEVFRAGDAASDSAALKRTLVRLWAAHTRATGMPCPFILGDAA